MTSTVLQPINRYNTSWNFCCIVLFVRRRRDGSRGLTILLVCGKWRDVIALLFWDDRFCLLLHNYRGNTPNRNSVSSRWFYVRIWIYMLNRQPGSNPFTVPMKAKKKTIRTKMDCVLFGIISLNRNQFHSHWLEVVSRKLMQLGSLYIRKRYGRLVLWWSWNNGAKCTDTSPIIIPCTAHSISYVWSQHHAFMHSCFLF